MKKYLFLLAFVSGSLVLLAGCGNFGNINSTAEQQNRVMGAVSCQPAETTDWEPTTF